MQADSFQASITLAMTRVLATVCIACAFVGCATPDAGAPAPTVEQAFRGDPGQPKSIFVFLDGTRNEAASRTNVRRAFDTVVAANDPQTTSIYIEGVGTVTTPVLGALLGLGMEPRILRGYDFIAQSYRPGDRLYIMGFSRGAHQARALAGLVAYAGVPPRSDVDTGARLKAGNAIIEAVKDIADEDKLAEWKAWQPGAAPVAAAQVRSKAKVLTTPAEVRFLGLWDTVPGSQFLDYGPCKERPNRNAGDRYKSDSYPPLRQIVHAVSLDEKRSKFHPILLCAAINPAFTQVQERWFAGAHADVGGGYGDSRALADIAFAWVMAELGKSYAPLAAIDHPKGNPLGLAHWSIGDAPANLMSHCEDRVPPPDATIDAGAAARREAGRAPLRMHGQEVVLAYPLSCAAGVPK
jgi:uncharacterized protein (DUF2235 family)